MTLRQQLVLLLFLGLASAASAAAKRGDVWTRRLVCGGGAFAIREAPSRGEYASGYSSQAMTVTFGRQRRRVRLDFDGEPKVMQDDQTLLPAAVGTLVCYISRDGKAYVSLEYTCNATDEDHPRVCHGEREWFRYLDPMGRRVDAGYRPQDPRYDGLLRRLKIDRPLRTTSSEDQPAAHP